MLERIVTGSKIIYRLNGQCHRPNGPARILEDGECNWYLYGRYHRYYGPQDIDNAWWIHGEWVKW